MAYLLNVYSHETTKGMNDISDVEDELGKPQHEEVSKETSYDLAYA